MVLKQYKFRLEFTMNIHELTKEIVQETQRMYSNYDEIISDPETWEHAERQKRLLHALLFNPIILKKYAQKEIVELVEADANEQVMAKLGVKEGHAKILRPVIESLDEEDSVFFNGAIKEGVFSENTSELSECFKLELTDAQILEIPQETN